VSVESSAGVFVPPPYPYDLLDEIAAVADAHDGGKVDLSIGTAAFRRAAAHWVERRLGAIVAADTEVAACVGTKEFVASLPQYLHLRTPDRDTVLYPAVSYPSYEMGATLAGLRAVPYRSLAEVDERDAARALVVWVNSPANPTGELDDLPAAAAWGRARGVPVASDECYAEFTWDPAGAAGPTTILREGPAGVLAVHSLSKRDNFAGARIGFYAGDPELVHYLREVRKHAGLMPSGPVQAAAVVALGDDAHVEQQRQRYLARLRRLIEVLAAAGYQASLPRGAFYLWVPAPDGDAWAAARDLAAKAGVVVSPGEFYGRHSAGYFRVAAVQPDDRIELAATRVGA